MGIKPNITNRYDHDFFQKHMAALIIKQKYKPHIEILPHLLEQLPIVDFKKVVFTEIENQTETLDAAESESEEAKLIEKRISALKLKTNHYQIVTVETVVHVANMNKWGLCINQESLYIYNGSYWDIIEREVFEKFLGEAAEKMGAPKYMARHFRFRDNLFKQFVSSSYLPSPNPDKNIVLINVNNGTFEVGPNGNKLRPFKSSDFMTYKLPFDFNPEAKAPIYQNFLNEVLPDVNNQNILAEYIGSIFIKHGSNSFKEEKALVLFGTGANGKSVIYEVVNALLGPENTSNYSLQSLTDNNGYYRAMIANKLVNYASEINGKLETSFFKQLVSGEPVEARLPYGKPFRITQYAKFIFNSNELPRDVEHTNAFFRRFLIIPFDVTIPEERQDKQLHHKIIDKELSGVFNLVLEGLGRLLRQKRFTQSPSVEKALETYKVQSDSVKLFVNEFNYEKSLDSYKLIKDLYQDYRVFCYEDGFSAVNKTNFIKRLKGYNITIKRINIGNVVYIEKK